MNDRRSVLIIYTGGTIGMMADAGTGALGTMDLDHLEEQMPELRSLDVALSAVSADRPIDSSDMGLSNWQWLAGIIGDCYERYDGFVVLHGSDTMAYTASAMSFMLNGLNKPVIFTGSQLPIGVKRTDARENLVTAIEIAGAVHADGMAMVPEVAIYFEYGLYRGNRTTKVSAERFEAFRSPNYPLLAEAGVHLRYDMAAIRDADVSGFSVDPKMDDHIGLVKLYPGISPEFISRGLDTKGLKGLVLETFGSGNGSTEALFLDVFRKAIDKGVAIVNVTQCIGGSVQLGKYGTSRAFKEMGMISGGDMTTEAALTKLMHLLGSGTGADELASLMQTSIAGELTQN
jgi:L-asparaginase